MRAVSLHPDVVLVRSLVWQTNCVVVRGTATTVGERAGAAEERPGEEVFVIDSPVLPEELELLGGLLEQAGFATVSALLATHADWDHLLGRLAFPGCELGCSESTIARLRASPGEAQRELRDFDEEHYLERERPLALGSIQGLPVPGRCEIGAQELELHPAAGHTADGMAIVIPWAGVLVAGDYCSRVEIPVLGEGGSPEAYLETVERLRELVGMCAHVVPGHGPALSPAEALEVLDQDASYLRSLVREGARAKLPEGRANRVQRAIHERNVDRLA